MRKIKSAKKTKQLIELKESVESDIYGKSWGARNATRFGEWNLQAKELICLKCRLVQSEAKPNIAVFGLRLRVNLESW
ncbi:MAG: hypothetical protein L3J83_06860 [Proteobacteria bacterium]|nr:hypothetical protein [Pseudomonadota bacterium]